MEKEFVKQMSVPTRFALYVVVIVMLAMGVMGGLVSQSQRLLVVFMGMVVTAVGTFFVALWLFNRLFAPVSRFRSAARTLLEQWGIYTADRDDDSALRDSLVHLTAFSEERLQALESERAKIGAVLDSMVEGVIALDRQGLVLLMNPSARRILDLGQESVVGQSLLEVIRNRGLADLVELCQTLEPSEQCRREVGLQLPVQRNLEVNAMPLPESQGVVLVLHDITELRRLEQVRVEFVANVSHELRTPLTAIKGYLETLIDEAPAEPLTHRRFLGVAHTHADRLSRLINDLLNLSDIETGKVVLRTRSVGLQDFVNEAFTIFEKEATKRGVKLQNEISADMVVWADRDRLSQIFVNLVDNAVKYTPKGGSVTFKAVARGSKFIGFQVIDTGQGIPPTDLPRITERFYRVDKARSRELGGTGLGLAIVKHLIQLHGGTLHIDSEVGKGTIIEIGLPIHE